MKRIGLILVSYLIAASVLLSVFIVPAGAESVGTIAARQYLSSAMSDMELAEKMDLSNSELDELKQCLTQSIDQRIEEINVSRFRIPVDACECLNRLVQNEWHWFFVRVDSYSVVGTQYVYSVNVSYLTGSQISAVSAAADKLLAGIEGTDLPDEQKALLLHDRLALHCEYDYESLRTTGDVSSPDSYTIYGCLVNRICVCQGYAETYNWLMNRLGIETTLCASEALNHVWNLVTIDGHTYNVDVTWDDPVCDVLGRVDHTYFLVSDQAWTGHNADDYPRASRDTRFDDAYWRRAESAFMQIDGSLYYIDSTSQTLCVLKDGTPQVLTPLADGTLRWPSGTTGYYWVGCYSRLASDGRFLFFNTADTVYRYDPMSGSMTEVLSPALPTGRSYSIFGFRMEDGVMQFRLNSSPNFSLSDPADTWAACAYTDPAAFRRISGTIASVGSGTASVRLISSQGLSFDAVVENDSYLLDNVSPGTYSLVVEKLRHVARTYTVTVTDTDVTLDVAICLYGDVNGDGIVSTIDAAMANACARQLLTLTDYQTACADLIGGDGRVTTADAACINSHVRGIDRLW